jgi:hypothetical protein
MTKKAISYQAGSSAVRRVHFQAMLCHNAPKGATTSPTDWEPVMHSNEALNRQDFRSVVARRSSGDASSFVARLPEAKSLLIPRLTAGLSGCTQARSESPNRDGLSGAQSPSMLADLDRKLWD